MSQAEGESDAVDTGLPTQVIEPRRPPGWREALREQTLANAMRKRAAGVPTYSVPEAAALLSISSEYLYRLIQRGGFPAVRMRLSGSHGRYVVPADAVNQLISHTTSATSSVEVSEWAANYTPTSRAVKEA
jgi:excisionase family DNA binding protein